MNSELVLTLLRKTSTIFSSENGNKSIACNTSLKFWRPPMKKNYFTFFLIKSRERPISRAFNPQNIYLLFFLRKSVCILNLPPWNDVGVSSVLKHLIAEIKKNREIHVPWYSYNIFINFVWFHIIATQLKFWKKMLLQHNSYTNFDCIQLIYVSWDTHPSDALKSNRLQVFTTLSSSKNAMHLLVK